MDISDGVIFATQKPGELRCHPQVFSPMKAGRYRDSADISFILEEPASVTIKIYDMAGRLEKVIAEDILYPQGINVVTWDGQNQKNEIVPSGPYVILVKASNWNKPQTRVVVVLNEDR